MPSEKLAGMMQPPSSRIPFMFKSPTCTQRDRSMAERMARIANVSLEELGQQIFSASWSDDKTPEELLFTDFKDFHIAGHDLGVGQITCVNSAHILERKQEFLEIMEEIIPWDEWVGVIEPYYPKGKRGRSAHGDRKDAADVPASNLVQSV